MKITLNELNSWKTRIDRLVVRIKVRRLRTVKVIIGGKTTKYDDWISTYKEIFDITSPECWFYFFEKNKIDSLQAEHVFEHLTYLECEVALSEAYLYMKRGGRFRIAVPDGYRKDKTYLEEVAPPRDGHKMVFNIDTLIDLIKSKGFKVKPLEYFDKDGVFHNFQWNDDDGYIQRSFRHDRQERFRRGDMYYTSIIVDAYKV